MKWKNPRGEITEVPDDETSEKYLISLGFKKVGDVYEIPDRDEETAQGPTGAEQDILGG